MKYIILTFKFCLLLLLTSCQKEANDAFGLSFYNLKGKVKEIKEIEYGVKLKSGVVIKAKEITSKHFTFTYDGKCQNFISTDESGKIHEEEYIYDSKKKLQNIIAENVDWYTPYYDDNNYLERQTLKLKSEEKPVTVDFKYDKSNNLISAIWYSEGNEYYSKRTNYDSKGTMTNQEEVWASGGKILYTCDSLGNTITEEHYPVNSEKPKTTYSYTYVYDDGNNWITKVKYNNNKAISLYERNIKYFDEGIERASVTPQKADLSSITSYFKNLGFRLFDEVQLGETPSMVLMAALLVLSLVLLVITVYRNRGLFANFGGIETHTGMKRMWMYNKEPYTKVATFLLIALCTFVAALVAIFLVGGAVWLLFWIIKILLYALVWIGIIATVIGALILFFGKDPWGLVLLIPGGLIWANDNRIEDAGNRLVETGFEFMQNLNMIQWGINLFSGYWDVMVLVFVAPLILFIGIALIIILINSLLIGIELIITKIYNIGRPCSVCGCAAEPYYLVNGKQHPVALRPGMYGVFTQKSPVTGDRLPTLLIGGRWKLNRECSGCGAKLNSKMTDGSKRVGFGTDIHIGIVGHRSSGKSYLLYSGLHMLMDKYPKKFTQIEANDEIRIEDKYRRIASREGIQTNDSNQYRAVQLIYKDTLRPIPYHLFFYDVAGEKFNASSRSHQTAMEFYQNVQSIIFVIDPKMVDYTGIPASEELKNWLKTQSISNYDEKYNIGSTFTILKEILDKANRKSKKIDFSFVCVKKDLKYFEVSGYNSEKIISSEIEKYICNDMGLNNVVYSAKAEFKSVRFYSVSTFTKDKESLNSLFIDVLKLQGVKI